MAASTSSLDPSACHSVLIRRNNKGFGFTLKEEFPCRVNTVQTNSAAAFAGLCAGDVLLKVNEVDVRYLSHHEVVDMIASAGSAVLLAVLSPQGPSSEIIHRTSRPSLRHQHSVDVDLGPLLSGAPVGRRKRSSRRSLSSTTTTTSSSSGQQWTMLDSRTSDASMAPRRIPIVAACYAPPAPREVIDRKVMLRSSAVAGSSSRRRRPPGAAAEAQSKCLSAPVFGEEIGETSLIVHTGDPFCLITSSDDDSEADEGDSSDLLLKAVLVYVGVIAVPCLAIPKRMMVRSALQTLKEQNVSTHTIMMQIYSSHVLLINTKLTMIRRFVAKEVAFVATCVENSQYFCIVTFRNYDQGGHNHEGRSGDCFVFAVDPGLLMHSFHYAYAKKFGIRCRAGADRGSGDVIGGCAAFPSSSHPILRALALFLKAGADHRPSNSCDKASAAPNLQMLRRSCRSRSNSDSGISNAKDDEHQSCSTCELASVSGTSSGTSNGLQPFPLFPRGAGLTTKQEKEERKEDRSCRPQTDVYHDHVSLASNAAERSYSDSDLFQKPSPFPRFTGKKIYKSMDEPVENEVGPSEELQPAPKSEQDGESVTACSVSSESTVVKEKTGKKYAMVLRRKLSNYVSSTWHNDKKKRTQLLKERYEKWRQDFDDLLKDPFGIRLFTKFLTNQHCEENIEFWQQCEIYKTSDSDVRSTMAMDIYEQYFASSCTYPINVDSAAKQKVENCVTNGRFEEQLFDTAQHQIFLLMKFDCYPRFLKWLNFDMVTTECEVQSLKEAKQALSEKSLNPSCKNLTVRKVKKNNAKNKRRMSLWFPLKGRRERTKSECEPGFVQTGTSFATLNRGESENDQRGRQSSDDHDGTSTNDIPSLCPYSITESHTGATTPGQDHQATPSRVAGDQDIVAFLLAIPCTEGGSTNTADNKKVISIKAKASCTAGQVLRPIFMKHGLFLDDMFICDTDSNEVLPNYALVATANNKFFTALTPDEFKQWIHRDQGVDHVPQSASTPSISSVEVVRRNTVGGDYLVDSDEVQKRHALILSELQSIFDGQDQRVSLEFNKKAGAEKSRRSFSLRRKHD